MGRVKVREAKRRNRESRVQQEEEKTPRLAFPYERPGDRLRAIPTHYEAKKKCQAISLAVKR